MKLTSAPARLGVALVLAPVLVILASGPALAADNIIISNTETVQAGLNVDGTLREARVYEQIALQGHGTVIVKNPVSTDNLRNLDGFGNVQVENGSAVSSQTVNGEQRLRTVSDFDKRLPLQVKVTYTLDGKTVKAGDVVGKSGRLAVRYTVANVTGKDQQVTYDDGTGKKITERQRVVIPMVGTLTTVLPSTFVDVTSAEATMAGDGQGQTEMSFTMTLFGPIGSPTSEFGYSATVSKGLIPTATISALPVRPLDSPSFKSGSASSKGGAETGVEPAAGATEIDANVLKLRDGAQTLLAGLIQLRDGAQALNTGLAGEAAPGSTKLADGGQAYAKAPELIDGLGQVSGGLTLVDGGLVEMYGGIGQLPTKAQPLHAGITQLLAGLGDKETADTLIFGVDAVRSAPSGAVSTAGSLDLLKGGVDRSKGGADRIKSTLDAQLAAGADIDKLKGGVTKAKNLASCLADPTCQALLGSVSGGVEGLAAELGQAQSGLGDISTRLGKVSPGLAELKTKLSAAATGLVKVKCGLSSSTIPGACDPARPGLLQGLSALDARVTRLVNGAMAEVQGGIGQAADVAPDQNTLRGGTHAVLGGIDLIAEGGLTLLDGLDQLGAGPGQLEAGTGELAAGANTLAPGGSRPSAEGTAQLIEAGKTTAADYGMKYAVIVAGAARAKTEAMAYGAPVGAAGETAYALEISGANAQGRTNVGTGAGALALFASGAGLLLFRRRIA